MAKDYATPDYGEKPTAVKLRKAQLFYMVVVGLFAVALLMLGSKYSITAKVASVFSEGLSDCSSSLDKCRADMGNTETQLSGCKADYANQGNGLDICNANQTACKNQLAACGTERNGFQGLLTVCNSDKSSLQGALSTCNTDRNSCQGTLSTCNNDKSSLQSNYNALAQNYASSKCCGTANYTYYYTESSNVVCTNEQSANTKSTGC